MIRIVIHLGLLGSFFQREYQVTFEAKFLVSQNQNETKIKLIEKKALCECDIEFQYEIRNQDLSKINQIQILREFSINEEYIKTESGEIFDDITNLEQYKNQWINLVSIFRFNQFTEKNTIQEYTSNSILQFFLRNLFFKFGKEDLKKINKIKYVIEIKQDENIKRKFILTITIFFILFLCFLFEKIFAQILHNKF